MQLAKGGGDFWEVEYERSSATSCEPRGLGRTSVRPGEKGRRRVGKLACAAGESARLKVRAEPAAASHQRGAHPEICSWEQAMQRPRSSRRRVRCRRIDLPERIYTFSRRCRPFLNCQFASLVNGRTATRIKAMVLVID